MALVLILRTFTFNVIIIIIIKHNRVYSLPYIFANNKILNGKIIRLYSNYQCYRGSYNIISRHLLTRYNIYTAISNINPNGFN